MEPKDAEKQVLEAAAKMRQYSEPIREGAASGYAGTVELGPGIRMRLLCWSVGGDSGRPIEISVGPSSARLTFGEAGLLVKMIQQLMMGGFLFEVERDEMLDQVLANAKTPRGQ